MQPGDTEDTFSALVGPAQPGKDYVYGFFIHGRILSYGLGGVGFKCLN
jgi:hypothetical protein